MRKALRGLAVLAMAGTFGVVGLESPAGAGNGQAGAPLTVEKVVVGTPPPGTQFVVQFQCEEGNNTVDEVVFDELGNPIGPNTTLFVQADVCQVVETQTGGAETVTYQCEGIIPDNGTMPVEPVEPGFGPAPQGGVTDPCSAAGPQSEPITVLIFEADQEATVTVTNTFGEPPPPPPPPPPPEPAPLIVQPRFTG